MKFEECPFSSAVGEMQKSNYDGSHFKEDKDLLIVTFYLLTMSDLVI